MSNETTLLNLFARSEAYHFPRTTIIKQIYCSWTKFPLLIASKWLQHNKSTDNTETFEKTEAILYVKKVLLGCPWANVEWYGFIQVSLFCSNLGIFSYFEELRCISSQITRRINFAFIPPHVRQQFIEEENGAQKLNF